jgi:hypothetical protein
VQLTLRTYRPVSYAVAWGSQVSICTTPEKSGVQRYTASAAEPPTQVPPIVLAPLVTPPTVPPAGGIVVAVLHARGSVDVVGTLVVVVDDGRDVFVEELVELLLVEVELVLDVLVEVDVLDVVVVGIRKLRSRTMMFEAMLR